MPKGFLVGLPSAPPERFRARAPMTDDGREVRGYISGDTEGQDYPQRSRTYDHDPQTYPDWTDEDRYMGPSVITPVRNVGHRRGISFGNYERHAKRGKIVNYPDE